MKAEDNRAKPEAEAVTNKDLARLVVLQNTAHDPETAQEFSIFVTNQSHQLTPFFQSICWQRNKLNLVEIMAVSGVSSIDSNAIIVRFMVKLVKAILAMDGSDKNKIIDQKEIAGTLRKEWIEMMPPYCQWLPFSKEGKTEAGMLIFYEAPVTSKQRTLFEPLSTTYNHVWHTLPENRKKAKSILGRLTRSSLTKWAILICVIIILAIPVRESALAPGQVVATKPAIVGSTVSGIIKQIHVQPNDFVKKGDLLISLDATESVSELEIRAESAELRVKQAKNILERTRIYASRDGIAIYTDVYEFLGQVVEVGQRIMLLADVNAIELNIEMPVGDTINFKVEDEVRFFLNTDPTRPVDAVLRQTSYEPRTEESGEYVFLLKASFEDEDFSGRIGWAGTAKVYSSDRVSLFMYIFRRPISSVRQFFGW